MYDTLWIGCSHSAGLYDINNNIVEPNAGIANRLAWGFNQKWKIVTFPGDGNHTFMEAVKLLDDTGHLSKFRNIIVQQTYEPRLNFYSHSAYSKVFDGLVSYIEDQDNLGTFNASMKNLNDKVFSILGREFYEIHEKNFINEKINFIDVAARIADEIDPRDPKLEHYAIWTKAALDYIKLVARKNDCNFYTFSWTGSYSTQPKDYPKKGLFKGEQNMFDLIREENLGSELSKPGSHPTEKILNFAFKQLTKELYEIGYT